MARRLIFVAIVTVVVAFDQGSKAWARTLPTSPPGCAVGELIAHRCGGVPQSVVDGYWDWELALNPGAAFSTLLGGPIVLGLIAAVAVVGIGVAAARTRPDQRLRVAALAAIAGGALGNLIDRVRDGAVTDFVRWRVHDHLWPIFNVADAALLVGVALLVVEPILSRRAEAGRTLNA